MEFIHLLIQQIFIQYLSYASTVLSARDTVVKKVRQIYPDLGNSLLVQWLGLSAFDAGPKFDPWSGN